VLTTSDNRPDACNVRHTRGELQPTDPPTVTVVLADDHPIVRGGLRALLSPAHGINVLAEAGTGDDAVREALLHRPDVLILDLQAGERGGIAAIREVLRSAPEVAVLVFTSIEDDDAVFTAMRAGARGYILKDAEREDIIRAIRGVAAGEAIFGAAIALRVTKVLSDPTAPARRSFRGLTAREREVLELVAAGLPNSAIARRLQLARKTVSNHMSAIFTKLRVADRNEAIARARDAGLGHAFTQLSRGASAARSSTTTTLPAH
jgi:DNA-binding NarL/FixJ family response regulator